MRRWRETAAGRRAHRSGIDLVVLKPEAAPRAAAAPSPGRSCGPSQVLEEARGALEVAAGALDALFCTSILLAALGRFTRGEVVQRSAPF